MPEDLTASLKKYFGFDEFRPGQREAVESLLNGRHTLAVMPTGSGKSLIYQLAALHLPGVTLVISPLIALMKDQVDALSRRSIPAAFINSALPAGEQNRRLKTLAEGGYRLVYIAPERLRSVNFLEAIGKQTVSLLAVDEAHCISEWGHDFRPDYLHIAAARRSLGDPLTAALTATATPQVQTDIARLLNMNNPRRIVTGFNRPNLSLEVRYVGAPEAKLRALRALMQPVPGGASIIYSGTRREAEEVALFLREIGVQAEHYHAGLGAEERVRIQDEFMSGRLPVVAATNAFGMGIDRADVRQVIHYNLPGSLEAYYQEAGRGGRDGLPARAVMLYAPDDRSLQEWFIKISAVTMADLRALFGGVAKSERKEVWISIEELSRRTGLEEVKVRVGLSELERAGALEHLGDEGLRMLLRLGEWNERRVAAAEARSKDLQRNRKDQLGRIVAYAEMNECRRQAILKHFGDAGPAEAEVCCDNCLAKEKAPAGPKMEPAARSAAASGDGDGLEHLDEGERTALAILDCVRRLRSPVGRTKLAQILKGSGAADIKKYHYDKGMYYRRLAHFRQGNIEELISQLEQKGYFKVVGGKYPVLALTPTGSQAIEQKAAIEIDLPRSLTPAQKSNDQAKRKPGGTIEYTLELFRQGLKPEEIARRRELSVITIYSHLAQLIARLDVTAAEVVEPEVKERIEIAIERVGSVTYLAPIKDILPDEISYEVVRCVVEGWKIDHSGNAETSTASYTKSEINETSHPCDDPAETFFKRPHAHQLKGVWSEGWALDFHSRYFGSAWQRSCCGELAYRLKYDYDLSVLPELVDVAMNVVAANPELGRVDALTPIPPTLEREIDPVTAFTAELGDRLGRPVVRCLRKTRQTQPQKELQTLAQKRANVAGAFAVYAPVKGLRLLLVDDLFDSGATLEEATRTLLQAGAAKVNVLTLTKTIHTEK